MEAPQKFTPPFTVSSIIETIPLLSYLLSFKNTISRYLIQGARKEVSRFSGRRFSAVDKGHFSFSLRWQVKYGSASGKYRPKNGHRGKYFRKGRETARLYYRCDEHIKKKDRVWRSERHNATHFLPYSRNIRLRIWHSRDPPSFRLRQTELPSKQRFQRKESRQR